MIDHSPPFPLILDYGPRLLKTWTPADEDGLLFALQHLSRANEIMLSAPQSTLAEMTMAMLEAAPSLQHLTLHSQSAELVLPKNFLEGFAPRLRHLLLTGVSLASLPPLLPSAISLVSLVLERVPSSAYFSPESLIAHIRSMPHLQILSIGFISAVPRPDLGSERFLPPGRVSQARIELPALTQLIYRGVSTYLEYLLTRTRAPLLQDIDITLFNQLTLRIPRTCTFISDLELFRPTGVRVEFAQKSAHILLFTASTPLQPSEPQSRSPDISVSVPCGRLDFQVSAMAHICSYLSGGASSGAHLLLSVEEFTLGFHQDELSEEWRGEEVVDPFLWRALLTPFRETRSLRVHVALVADLGRALLHSTDGPAFVGEEIVLEQEFLFPELHTIVLLHGDDERVAAGASEALGAFVDERNRAGHPVNVEPQNLSKLCGM